MSTAIQLKQKEKIEMELIDISDKAIRVSSASTSFVDVYPLQISYEDTMERYKALLKLAREMGAKVVYRYKSSTNIQSLKESILSDLALYQDHYDLLKRRWKDKAHNMHVGFADDDEYNALSNVRNVMWSLTNTNTPIGELIRFSRRVNDATHAIHSSNGHCTIYV